MSHAHTFRASPIPLHKQLRRCLTLPHPDECSTISAGRLSFRVRNGTGRFPTAITTAKTRDTTPHNRGGPCIRPHRPPPHSAMAGDHSFHQWTRTHNATTVGVFNSCYPTRNHPTQHAGPHPPFERVYLGE